jgi:hypothetical protein
MMVISSQSADRCDPFRSNDLPPSMARNPRNSLTPRVSTIHKSVTRPHERKYDFFPGRTAWPHLDRVRGPRPLFPGCQGRRGSVRQQRSPGSPPLPRSCCFLLVIRSQPRRDSDQLERSDEPHPAPNRRVEPDVDHTTPNTPRFRTAEAKRRAWSFSPEKPLRLKCQLGLAEMQYDDSKEHRRLKAGAGKSQGRKGPCVTRSEPEVHQQRAEGA